MIHLIITNNTKYNSAKIHVEYCAVCICSAGCHGDHCCSSSDNLCNSRLHGLPLSPQVSISIMYFNYIAFKYKISLEITLTTLGHDMSDLNSVCLTVMCLQFSIHISFLSDINCPSRC